MGVVASLSDRIAKWFTGEKASVIPDLKRGDNLSDVLGGPGGDIQSANGASGMRRLAQNLQIEQALMHRYAEFEEMDDYPEIGSALDVYADDATVNDAQHDTCIWPISSDDVVRQILNDLLYRRLRIDEDIYELTRGLAKYGNAFAEVIVDESGVVGLNYLPAPTVRRLEDDRGRLLGFIQSVDADMLTMNSVDVHNAATAKQLPQGVVYFEPWEVIHWRMRGKRVQTMYGYSVLDSARWVFRRLTMAEDSALVYKLTRAPARYAFYVNTGTLPPQQRMAYVNQIKNSFKKRKLFNASTGKIDFQVNPLSQDEDFFVPTSPDDGDSTRIEVLSGPDYQTTDDLEYFRSKLFSAIKVPRRYLGFDGGESRASLAQEDVRFARTVMRLQREVRNGYKQVCRVHLAALNIDPDQVDYDLRMSVSSSVFELSQIELLTARAQVAELLSNYMPKEWILERVFEFSTDDAIFTMKQKRDEQRDDAMFATETQKQTMDELGIEGDEESAEFEGELPGSQDESFDKRLKKIQRLVERVEKHMTDLDEVQSGRFGAKRSSNGRSVSGSQRNARVAQGVLRRDR
jgi:hypothetical protein